MKDWTIVQAMSGKWLDEARALFVEYANSLDFDLGYQGFADELSLLPGAYAPPRGRLLLAIQDQYPAGCVALRPRDTKSGEMKRLYVRPNYQGQGLGRLLTTEVLAQAKQLGYRRVLLDTAPGMHAAHRLYASLGFAPCLPYYDSTVPGTIFMERQIVE